MEPRNHGGNPDNAASPNQPSVAGRRQSAHAPAPPESASARVERFSGMAMQMNDMSDRLCDMQSREHAQYLSALDRVKQAIRDGDQNLARAYAEQAIVHRNTAARYARLQGQADGQAGAAAEMAITADFERIRTTGGSSEYREHGAGSTDAGTHAPTRSPAVTDMLAALGRDRDDDRVRVLEALNVPTDMPSEPNGGGGDSSAGDAGPGNDFSGRGR